MYKYLCDNGVAPVKLTALIAQKTFLMDVVIMGKSKDIAIKGLFLSTA